MEDYYTDLDEVLGELRGVDSKDQNKMDELIEEAEGFVSGRDRFMGVRDGLGNVSFVCLPADRIVNCSWSK